VIVDRYPRLRAPQRLSLPPCSPHFLLVCTRLRLRQEATTRLPLAFPGSPARAPAECALRICVHIRHRKRAFLLVRAGGMLGRCALDRRGFGGVPGTEG